jgi:phosphatidate cytidylyltransferase
VLRARLATAAVAIPLLLLLILYGPGWLLALVVAAIAIVGVGEYATMAFQKRPAERVLTMVLGVLVVAAAASEGELRLLAAALSLSVAAGLVWTLFARPDFEQGLSDLGLALIGILYAGLLMPHFIWLRNLDAVDAHDVRGPLWVIFVLVIGMAGDTGGYMMGHALGRHKLMPRVSPGKTIEGSVGIMLASLLAGAVAKLIFLQQRSWTEVLVLAFVMGILCQLGDLSESIMKRTFGVKESGWLFPGHGGVLDRIDSLLFPVAFLYYHVAWFR